MTDYRRLRTVTTAISSYSRALTVLLVASLLLFPVLLYLVWTSVLQVGGEWEQVLLQSSLQNGIFWLLPGQAIFQSSMAVFNEDQVGILPAILVFLVMLIPTAIVVALSCRSLAMIVKIILCRSIPRSAAQIWVDSDSLLYQLLPKLSSEPMYRIGDMTTGTIGRSLVMQIDLAGSILPPMLFDSPSDIAKREGRRLQMQPSDELVLDGTTFEHFRIYAHHDYHHQLTYVLQETVIAVLVKKLDKADILIENGELTAIVDVRQVVS